MYTYISYVYSDSSLPVVGIGGGSLISAAAAVATALSKYTIARTIRAYMCVGLYVCLTCDGLRIR